MQWNILIPAFILIKIVSSQRDDCSNSEYERCTRIADPLIKEAHLVFPDNMADLEIVCKTWNKFVECLRSFTDNCFNDNERKEFNKAVQSPISSIHDMCEEREYQKKYFLNAPCIKSTIIEKQHCGLHYNFLVSLVEKDEQQSKSSLCCSHERFKQCVLRETKNLCDRGVSNGPAFNFAAQIIDKALKYLQDQCSNYIPNSVDCATSNYDSYSDRSNNNPSASILSTSASNAPIYPWTTTQQYFPTRYPKVSINNNNDDNIKWSTSISPMQESDSSNFVQPTQLLGTRTRTSHGRSHWASTDSNNNPNLILTSPIYPSSISTPIFRDNFGTQRVWDNSNNNNRFSAASSSSSSFKPSSSDLPTTTPKFESSISTLWKPETTPIIWHFAGDQMHDEVDEPNQLGLLKPKNNGNNCKIQGFFNRTILITFIVAASLLGNWKLFLI